MFLKVSKGNWLNDLSESFSNFEDKLDNYLSEFDAGRGYPKVDIYEVDGKFVVEAGVPGLTKDDITVELNDSLVISGRKQNTTESKRNNYHFKSLRKSSFTKIIPINKDVVDFDSVKSSIANGLLRIEFNMKTKESGQSKLVEITEEPR